MNVYLKNKWEILSMKKRKSKVNQIDSFRGQEVVVYISSLNMSEQDPETGLVTSGNLVARGIFISHDAEHYFLGDNDGNVYEMIRKTDVARISLEADVPQDINVEIPQDEKKWN